MMKAFVTLLVSAILSAGVVTSAQLGTAADENAIVQRLSTYAAARMKRDAHAEALCYTEDGDFRSSAGPFVTGRANIEKQLAVTDPRYRFSLEPASLRFLSPDVAIVEADIQAGVQSPLTKLVGTYVMVRRTGDWLIGAARIVPAMR